MEWNVSSSRKADALGPAVKGYASRDTFLALADSYLPKNLTRRDLMLADRQCYLPDDILAKADRMSMANGLEIRPVFLDPRIARFSERYSKTHTELFSNKEILKLSLRRILGDHYKAPKKQGFSIPVHLWFRTKLKDLAGDLFHSQVVKDSGLYNQQELLKLWQMHQDRKQNLGFELWGIMVALLWYKNIKSQSF